MKDKAIEGIASARQKDRLANDAAVADRNKKGVGKRTNISSGLSSTKSPSLSVNQLNKQNLINNISSSSTQDAEAKKRLQNRQKMQNQAIKVAEKIPVVSKYAKMAKMAEKIKNVKSNKGNPLKNIFGGNSSKEPTPAEAEEVMGAEQRGEEYKPEQAETKFTAINSKTTKLIIIWSILGFMCANVFICVILVSAITDTAGKSYLETKENPTEDELAERYSANEEDSSSSSNSNSSNNNNNQNSNSSSSNSSSNKNNIIYVGDSRMVGLCLSVNLSSKEDCSIAKGSMGYNWFSNTALPQIKSKLNSNKNSTVVIYMGTNDLLNNGAFESYAKDYNQLAKDYNDSSIMIVSVTEIDDNKAVENGYQVKNSQVVNFNNSLKKSLSSDVKYCDVYSKINNNFNTSDGIHYTSDTYKNIYQQIQNCL